MDENKVNLFDFIQDKISCYDEYYAEEIGLNYLDDEDIYNIVAEILNNQEIEDIVYREIEEYANTKKHYRENG